VLLALVLLLGRLAGAGEGGAAAGQVAPGGTVPVTAGG